MFNIAFLVEDKRLAEVLRTLDGAVYDIKVTPVRNAKPKADGAVKSTAADRPLEALAVRLNKLRTGTALSLHTLSQWAAEVGGGKTMGPSYARQLVKGAVIRRIKGKRGHYEKV